MQFTNPLRQGRARPNVYCATRHTPLSATRDGHQSPCRGHHNERGFTLIEVLVALAIIAVALGAALRATQVMLDNSRAIRGKTLALLAAENTLAQLRLERTFPRAGTRTRPCPQGNLALRCEIEIRNSMNRNFRQVTVRVMDAERNDATLAQLSGLLSQIR